MANLKALVCDDEAPLRDLMARRLEKMGLDVERAESGKDAVARIDAGRYDLLVTDIYMPDVTGLELLQRMKALDPHAQVVVVTASATLDNAVGALNHGAFAYLTKPFDHLTVFDNVVSRAVEFRRALLDNLRMGEVQRRRGDMLEEEVTGRIIQVKRAQQNLVELLACLPVGVVVLDEAGRVDLINPVAEELLESTLAVGPQALNDLVAGIPLEDDRRRGEAEIDGRKFELHLSALTTPDEPARQVLVMLEPGVASGPALGTIVQEMLVNLRGGLAYLGRREKDEAARKVLRGMASELTSLATFLDIQLPDDRSEEKGGNGLPAAASRTSPDAAGLAPAVIPPATPASETPGNGHKPNPPRGGRPPTEPLPQRTGSQMLRKGMTMVLEGRIQKKGGYGEPPSRPADPEKMQQQIDRWARSGGLEDEVPEGAEEDAGGSASAWPPPLPSSDQ